MLFGSVTAAPGKVMLRKLPEAAAGAFACAAEALAAEPRAKTGASATKHHKAVRFTRTSVGDGDKGPSGQMSRPYAAESGRVNEAQRPLARPMRTARTIPVDSFRQVARPVIPVRHDSSPG